ncbi:MAG: helix-turn-helix domain-containing protein [Pseudomonadota bacterium]
MDVYSTSHVPPDTRTNYWNQVYSSRFAQVTFNPLDHQEFEAELKLDHVGDLGIARVRCKPTDIERTRSHIERSPRRLFSFVMQLRGSSVFSHYGHEITLEEGDFTLCDNATPHRLRFTNTADFIILRLRPETLRTYLPNPERVCGLKLPAREAFTASAATMVQTLWDQVERGLPTKFDAMVTRAMLEVLSTSYALAFDPWIAESSVVSARRAEARQFIETHLKDPDLSPGMVARALRISPRYLRMLFAPERETVSAYILRRRLEECARQIASPLWRGQTLTDIAFRYGFNSAAHFTRVFRDHFGVTPRQYRKAHLSAPPLSLS